MKHMTELVFILECNGPMAGLGADSIGKVACSVRAARLLSAEWKHLIDEDVQKRGR